MRSLMVAFCALALIVGLSASPDVTWAQTGTPAQALTTCGTPVNAPVSGSYYSVTMNTSSQLCVSTTPSSTPQPISGATSNASSGVATTSTNIPSVSYNYNFNGTTWDQAKTLPGLTISGVGLPAAGIASVYNTTLPTYTNGQYGALQMSPQGGILLSGQNGTAAATVNATSPADGQSAMLGLSTTSQGMLEDIGSNSWVRARDVTGLTASGTGVTAVEEDGTTFTEITTGTSTTVKGSAGVLHQICVNTIVGSATIKAYNALSATGTPITITLPATITGDNPFCLKYDIYFGTGIFVVTSGATDVTVTYR